MWKDPEFTPLKNVCNSLFKRLHNSGVGVDIKSTPVVSPDDEIKLWETGVLSMENPTGLLRAVFFYNGQNFCLRGGQEQRALKLSQIRRETTVVNGMQMSSYVYTEFG